MAVKNATKHSEKLDVSALENWLWEAACIIRGPVDVPKYKDCIMPPIFLKRLSDVFDDEVAHLARDFGDEKSALMLVQQDPKLVRSFLPEHARWAKIALKMTGLAAAMLVPIPAFVVFVLMHWYVMQEISVEALKE